MVPGIGSFEHAVFDGTYALVNSPAITDLTGGLFPASSSLLIELGGTQEGAEYDHAVDSGVPKLVGGTLHVVLEKAFGPSLGDCFEILQYGQLSDDFGTVNVPAVSGDPLWWRITSATAMTLTIVPGPSTGVTVLAALACRGFHVIPPAAAITPPHRMLNCVNDGGRVR